MRRLTGRLHLNLCISPAIPTATFTVRVRGAMLISFVNGPSGYVVCLLLAQ